MPKTPSRPIIRIHNVETDEVIDREMNNAEFADHQAKLAKIADTEAEIKAQSTARQAILNRLGLTADEAALILG
jgi:hypothetical protein